MSPNAAVTADARQEDMDNARLAIADAETAIDLALADIDAAQMRLASARGLRQQAAAELVRLEAEANQKAPHEIVGAKGEATVPMYFPRPTKVAVSSGGAVGIGGHRVAEFPAGVQPVPSSLADHWFL